MHPTNTYESFRKYLYTTIINKMPNVFVLWELMARIFRTYEIIPVLRTCRPSLIVSKSLKDPKEKPQPMTNSFLSFVRFSH